MNKLYTYEINISPKMKKNTLYNIVFINKKNQMKSIFMSQFKRIIFRDSYNFS